MAKEEKKKVAEERVELKGELAEFREALEAEIDKIKKSGQTSTILVGGRRMESNGGDFWYRFNVEYMPVMPADTPCKLIIGNEQFNVTVISYEENAVIISSKVQLPEAIGRALLENGATVLMERLIKCIEENAEKENPAGRRMLTPDGELYEAKELFHYDDLTLGKNNNEGQNKAIISALSKDITYIWGPPGTGKTTVIGQIIDELYKHERSVLVVSHTNTAVDGAIDKACGGTAGKEKETPILRLGVPVKPLPEDVLLDSHVARLGKELFERKAELEKQQVELKKQINKLLPIIAKDTWIKENELEYIGVIINKIKEYEKEIEALKSLIDETEDLMQQEKNAHPEYTGYLALARKVKAKKTEYEEAEGRLLEAESRMEELAESIQKAKDEIRKHSVYAKFKEEESKLMTDSLLRSEISKIKERIDSSEKEFAELRDKRTKAENYIVEYNRKSSFEKIFIGKNAFLESMLEMQKADERIPEVEAEIRRLNSLKSEYDEQLESVLILQEKINAVNPTETPEYWERFLERTEEEQESVREIISVLTDKKAFVCGELSGMETELEKAKAPFDIISEYGRKIQQTEEKIKKVSAERNKAEYEGSEKLGKERSLCAEFYYSPTADKIVDLFAELSELLVNTKAEIENVNVEELKKEKAEKDTELTKIFEEISEIVQKIEELEKQAIMSAKIVGTTLAKSYLSDTLRERTFDTVILDEASMASIPALWCACYLAEKSLIIVGDFLQLSPIVMAGKEVAKRWLGKDIFYHSGMQDLAKNKNTCPENFVMLNEQFRMEPEIAEIANIYYREYGGLLSKDNMSERRVKERGKFEEWYSGKKTKRNIHLIDTKSLHTWVTGVPQGRSHSRLNCFSAAVDVDLAFKFIEKKLEKLDADSAEPVEKPLVLIVAPYKPHIARINKLIESEYRSRGLENLNYIRAGTIHSFQGSEADIVIFDLVLDEPHFRANLFMPDEEINEGLRKMFNVAITRAKFKLYIVGNFAYCQRRARNNALSEFLEKLIEKERYAKVDAKELLPRIKFVRDTEFRIDKNAMTENIVCREDSFNDYFMDDIRSFNKRMIIYSPFITAARLGMLLPAFADAINEGKQIVVVTKALSDRGQRERTQYIKCEEALRDIGVDVIHKKGMHEKLVFVDDKAVCVGSLNALSFTGQTGEVMQKTMVKSLLLNMQKFIILSISAEL